jgi:hypothetical protein
MQKQAIELLQVPSINFNLSDLKADKTVYHESPQHSVSNLASKSPFKHSEISARSTLMKKLKPIDMDADFDEIMRTSVSADVRNKYRESVGMGRLSVMPRTTDVSTQSAKTDDSFWGPAKMCASSFKEQNASFTSDEFRPAEEMSEKMRKDQYEQEQEYAPIPNVEPLSNLSSWEGRTWNDPKMSFGVYSRPFLFNCKEVFGKEESMSEKNRVPMIDDEKEKSVNLHNTDDLQKWLSKFPQIFHDENS